MARSSNILDNRAELLWPAVVLHSVLTREWFQCRRSRLCTTLAVERNRKRFVLHVLQDAASCQSVGFQARNGPKKSSNDVLLPRLIRKLKSRQWLRKRLLAGFKLLERELQFQISDAIVTVLCLACPRSACP